MKRKTNNREKIPIKVQLKLWVKAGGRCEFGGCNEYLLRDNLTLSETNYSDIAHIIAVSKNGPRGDDPLPLPERNKISNLMLACKKHHKLIDDKEHVNAYPKSKLELFKKDHEDRIYKLTKIRPANKTLIVRFKSNIGKDVVHVPIEQIQEAIYPRYPLDEEGVEIDLTAIRSKDNQSYWKVGGDCIEKQISALMTSRIDSPCPDHISVFAFGPIPFLIFLGNCLGNKADIDIYQRHRDSKNWLWKQSKKAVRYKYQLLKRGKDFSKVALIISLSGKILPNDLPKKIVDNYYIYEITIVGQTPNPMFIKSRKDLIAFKRIYHQALSAIRKQHNKVTELLMFPAVPVSIAVVCGTERLPKAHPTFVVYDFNRSKSGFIKTLKVR